MKTTSALLALTLVACSNTDDGLPVTDSGGRDASVDGAVGHDAGLAEDAGHVDTTDSGAGLDASLDASTDAEAADATLDASDAADAGTCPTVLLKGGAELAAEGWMVYQQQPSTLAIDANAVHLTTTTNQGARTSGQLLLAYPNAVQPGVPFKLEVVMRVDSVSAHNPLDSAAAILGSFTPSVGSQDERKEMVYVDISSVGWADDTQSAPVTNIDGQPHTYLLSVDAQNTAHVFVDGVEKLTRENFTTNGTIAIGDQTNDPNVDAVTHIVSVTKLCL